MGGFLFGGERGCFGGRCEAGFDYVRAEGKEVVELRVALGILLEDLADNGYWVGMNAEHHGREGLSLLENEAVVPKGVCCPEQGLDPLRLSI